MSSSRASRSMAFLSRERPWVKYEGSYVQGGLLGVLVAPSWWWEGDPRWTWHAELVAPLATSCKPPVIDDADSLRAAIEGGGFETVSIGSEHFDLHIPDAEMFWRWVWSHGSRAILEPLTPEQLARYREVVFDRIGTEGIDGRMVGLLVTARKPA